MQLDPNLFWGWEIWPVCKVITHVPQQFSTLKKRHVDECVMFKKWLKGFASDTFPPAWLWAWPLQCVSIGGEHDEWWLSPEMTANDDEPSTHTMCTFGVYVQPYVVESYTIISWWSVSLTHFNRDHLPGLYGGFPIFCCVRWPVSPPKT